MINESLIQSVCDRALKIITGRKLHFRPMVRKTRLNIKRGFIIGRTNLKTKLITIDIRTPKKRQFKKISSILRVLCHETAHHQKKPFRQYFHGRRITRRHYPEFYQQVKKNIEKLKKSKEMGKYFQR